MAIMKAAPPSVVLGVVAVLAAWRNLLVRADPVVVTNYPGLVGTVGSNNAYDTGDRFSREAVVLFHKAEAGCLPDFYSTGLSGFEIYPDMYALISVDVDHADEDLLSRFDVDPASLQDPGGCPVLVSVKRRSPVDRPELLRPQRDNQGSFGSSFIQTQQVSVGIVNEVDFPLDIHYQWWDEPVKPTYIQNLQPGKENWMISFKTTTIVAVNRETNQEVQRFFVKGHNLFPVARRECSAETCGNSEGQDVPTEKTYLDRVKRHDEGRQHNNIKQPQGLPRFTEVGFKKTKVPDDIWDAVKTYYEENKDSPKKEVWDKYNVFTNNIEAPSYMVNLPENGPLKANIFDGLRPVLEEWSGVELEATACYGIRVYTNTSWLANHVDTRATHAVSLIMQVDQDVEDDWPLMIYDHAGNNYNITMKPRDMVLYESATCVHGRPSILNGNFYANAFVHYRPVDTEKWTAFVNRAT